ncbi:glycosyltransferase family 2 protein [Luteirhabdus pelagi]|uniref:glycosyltransferase family 2 protein n=1 Tax=Luteirhabdus pelagi TaxID=2792783 RepID=UPI00193AB4F4|nr:glycosyltransferase family 2 protein [Luteirhabdus pelagi]
MLSILIPTYNYDVVPLVKRLQEEIQATKKKYEIIVCDDASPSLPFKMNVFDSFSDVSFLHNKTNFGRTATRQKLAEKASYDHLLFLDADVFPKYPNFLERFHLKEKKWDVQFGGIAYKETPPQKEKLLRWKYGRAREEVSMLKRLQNPYFSINSGCILMRKELFFNLNEKMKENRYGLDIYFKQLLKQTQATVLHIDNPVYHLGLESSEAFLKKSLQAVATTVSLEKEGKLTEATRPMQNAYKKISRFGLAGLFQKTIDLFRSPMKRNFLSTRPNLFWFDLYRLAYYCKLKRGR